jgi:hypothetical protein
MNLTVNLWSRKKGELKRFLECYYEREVNLNGNDREWSHIYGKPVEAVDIISAVVDNNDKYQIAVSIQVNEGQMHMITPENHNDIIKDIFQLFYGENNIYYN